ncbi:MULTISPECIES: hypothetical protein [Rhodococcus]|uniref:hypothetical protein n=1 Tax=Rhodococcus TaxID=1827 RepID=UPI00117C7B96|nr:MULTISPECIES: hypothetical protein [Rhodococcus]UDH01444.1 hypothetical protein K2Z90_007969 [Rhodococcus opacus PD630]
MIGDLQVASRFFCGLPEPFDETPRRHPEPLECLVGRYSAVWCPDQGKSDNFGGLSTEMALTLLRYPLARASALRHPVPADLQIYDCLNVRLGLNGVGRMRVGVHNYSCGVGLILQGLVCAVLERADVCRAGRCCRSGRGCRRCDIDRGEKVMLIVRG